MFELNIVVGIGDYAISNKQGDILKTYALASCVGVTIYCPENGVAAMIHIVLPDHQLINSNIINPFYFVSTGVPLLLDRLEKEYGCKKKDLVIRLYGGTNSVNQSDFFHIGRKNLQAITSLLTDLNLRYCYSDVGGNESRTIEMKVASGDVKVFKQPITI